MTVFVLKIIACISMFLDHVKYAIPETKNFATIYLGRIAFPIFAFLITQGYIHTSNFEKYYKRIIIFALISQIPFMLFRSLIDRLEMLNIMFTLLLGLISIMAYDKIKKKYISIPICAFLIIFGEIINVDYGWFGVALVFLFYLCRNNKIMLACFYTILVLVWFYFVGMLKLEKLYILYFINYLISLLIILSYNGKQGRKIKYFFYWFYPVHMLILYLVSFVNI